ncbi:MAG: 50S ribosomal protein L21 [Actinobacteria bacterium]|jgi:large subunit ribosomal protein L21|nr:50S ribosomal protein L21 [Actinomycetota bacterium]
MYAIVKAGGRQEKVTVGETITVDRIDAAVGASVSFPALLLVDGANVTTDIKALSAIKVTGEVIEEVKGPKIDILRYKNKTGHRRRQGFRAQHTLVKITAISGAK